MMQVLERCLQRVGVTLITSLVVITASACGGSNDNSDTEVQSIINRLRGITDPGPSQRFQLDEDHTWDPFDLNNDGVADMWKIYAPAEVKEDEEEAALPSADDEPPVRLVRKEVDTNFDNKVDIWFVYDEKEVLKQQVSDADFDGVVDFREFYEEGRISLRESFDKRSDTKPTVKKFFTNGKLTKIEFDNEPDGKTDRWEIYQDSELKQVGFDNDGDGQIDYWRAYDEDYE